MTYDLDSFGLDSFDAFGWTLSRDTAGDVWETWALHDHPVLQRIHANRARGYWCSIPGMETRAGTALQQTVTEEEAHALRAHFARVWELAEVQHARRPSPGSGKITAGGHLATLYGVRILVEDLAPLVAEAQGPGGGGFPGVHAFLGGLLPAGTRLEAVFRPESVTLELTQDSGVFKMVKEQLARKVGEPHVLAVLNPQDLHVPGEGIDLHHLQDLGARVRVLFAGTFRAIPGATTHIVLRPAAALEGASCWVAADWDGRRIERRTPSPAALGVPLVQERKVQLPDRQAADAVGRAPSEAYELVRKTGVATPTGRVEVSEDGTVAEVYEVALPPEPAPVTGEGAPVS
ncbi:hypothetical protein GCM10022252_75080 [Streptosporangium oxazolinicum]|uniref:Uncharacterized protein n=1 Tax=Streptosporangium oxazolinicum TaxID=909287 RepID=A0ABP8BKE0_9ACTN